MSESGEPFTVVTGVTEDKYEYLWKIQNFSLVQKSGIQLESQKFEVKLGKNALVMSRWVVGLKNNENASCYYVYCKLLEIFSRKRRDHLATNFCVQLRKADNSVYWTVTQNGNVKIDEGFDLASNYTWSSSSNFSGFLDENGALTLYIKLTITEPFCESTAIHENYDMIQEQFNLKTVNIVRRNMGALLHSKSSEFDVEIVCSDEKRIKCHKSILKSSSTVFSSMLESDFSEANTGVINVREIPSKAMQTLLHYIYTGKLKACWSEPDVIVDLTYAAGKYQLMELLEYLDNMLGSTMNHKSPSILFSLLDLSTKLALRKAEAILHGRIVKLTVSAENGTELLSIFRGED